VAAHMMPAMSLPALTRIAEQALARDDQTRRMPVVHWAPLEGVTPSFAASICLLRERLPGHVTVIVVAPWAAQQPAMPGVRLVELAPKLFRLLHPSAPRLCGLLDVRGGPQR
jgi:hypothetical protein